MADAPKSAAGKAPEGPSAGLCVGCRHARTVASRTASYTLCEHSFSDPSYPKYPNLPVLSCAAFAARHS